MTIQRIDNDAKRMHGWQARWYIGLAVPGQRRPYASRFFADRKHGGRWLAKRLAKLAEKLQEAF